MYTVAYRICGNYDAANDVLQEAFIQVFRDIDQFRQDSTLGRWIKTIVVRTAIKKIRNEKLFIPLEEGSIDYPVEVPDYLDGEHLEKAILSLPEGFRAVFLLIEVEGYSHKEVGAILGISEGTSKSQLFHAKKRLQKTIKSMMQIEIQK